MVHIFSSHGPLVNQLKPARPIWAGFLHAFSTSKHQHDFSMQRMHRSRPSASASTLPRLSLKVFFSAPNLSSHQTELSRVFTRAMSPSAMGAEDGALHMEDTATLPPMTPSPRCHMENQEMKGCFVLVFCSLGAQANGSARLFPSRDNEPQP